MTCPSLSRFDWYQGTLPDDSSVSGVDVLLHLSDGAPTLVPGRLGYSRGWALTRDGSSFATVYQGASRGDHVWASGPAAPVVAGALRCHQEGHSVSRADACVDFSGGSDFFRDVRSLAVSAFSGRVIMTDYVEHGLKGDASTFYVGSRKSETRIRLYEKGKQDDGYAADVVRLEVQVRPQTADRKAYAATVEPDAFFGFARWSRRLFSEVADTAVPAAPNRSERVSDLDGALDTLALQYGKRLLELEQRYGGDAAAAWVDLVSRVRSVA